VSKQKLADSTRSAISKVSRQSDSNRQPAYTNPLKQAPRNYKPSKFYNAPPDFSDRVSELIVEQQDVLDSIVYELWELVFDRWRHF